MRALFALSLLASAGAAAACATEPEPESATADQAVVETTRFRVTPGIERTKQHRGPVDVVQNQKQSLDLTNAYWMARLSQIVYRDLPELKAQLEAVGLKTDADHFRYFEDKCTDTQAFYVTTASLAAPPETISDAWNKTSNDVAVLSFRGTERGNKADLGTDLYAWSRPNVLSIGNVHAGFFGALASVWERRDPPKPECGQSEPIGAFLRKHHELDSRGGRPTRKGAELYFTGHSLGAALATVALAKTAVEQCEAEGGTTTEAPCFKLYTPVSGLVTFGSPRAGNRSFATTLANWMQDRTPIFRFIHGKDAVTRIPGSGFYHVGFDGDGEKTFAVHIGDAPLRMTVGDIGERGDGTYGGDHVLPGYLSVLEKLLAK